MCNQEYKSLPSQGRKGPRHLGSIHPEAKDDDWDNGEVVPLHLEDSH